MNLLEISDSYKKTADKFLHQSKIVSVLEKYGRIEFEGAYAANLMLHGDIDIKVIGPEDYSNDMQFQILRDIYDTCGEQIRSLFIKADWDDPRFGQQYPFGKYIGVKTLFNNERWKVDIWFISEMEAARERSTLDISKTQPSENQRLQILECKQYRKDHSLKTSGQEIYEAVLNGDYFSPEAFFKSRI